MVLKKSQNPPIDSHHNSHTIFGQLFDTFEGKWCEFTFTLEHAQK